MYCFLRFCLHIPSLRDGGYQGPASFYQYFVPNGTRTIGIFYIYFFSFFYRNLGFFHLLFPSKTFRKNKIFLHHFFLSELPSRNRIIPTPSPRVTPHNPFYGKPAAFQRPMFLYRFNAVLRASGHKTALLS